MRVGRSQVQRHVFSKALTLLECLIVIGVVAILAALLFPALSRAKERARKIQCNSNLRQTYIALYSFACDNEFKLPDCTTNNPPFYGAWWPWDVHTNLANELQYAGAVRDVLYCPANAGMNNDERWNFWKYDSAPIRVLGYAFLLKGCKDVPPDLWRSSVLTSGLSATSDAEMVFDATMSQNGDFTYVTGKYTDRTSHIRGASPLGGNIAFLDGHVAWRPFNQMTNRIDGNALWYY
jgi:prepilin-type processing-associated H-X9-DG protein